jgi:hypothetical protein
MKAGMTMPPTDRLRRFLQPSLLREGLGRVTAPREAGAGNSKTSWQGLCVKGWQSSMLSLEF